MLICSSRMAMLMRPNLDPQTTSNSSSPTIMHRPRNPPSGLKSNLSRPVVFASSRCLLLLLLLLLILPSTSVANPHRLYFFSSLFCFVFFSTYRHTHTHRHARTRTRNRKSASYTHIHANTFNRTPAHVFFFSTQHTKTNSTIMQP